MTHLQKIPELVERVGKAEGMARGAAVEAGKARKAVEGLEEEVLELDDTVKTGLGDIFRIVERIERKGTITQPPPAAVQAETKADDDDYEILGYGDTLGAEGPAIWEDDEGAPDVEMGNTNVPVHPERRQMIASDSEESVLPQAPAHPLTPAVTRPVIPAVTCPVIPAALRTEMSVTQLRQQQQREKRVRMVEDARNDEQHRVAQKQEE
jgi:hypothetical protein